MISYQTAAHGPEASHKLRTRLAQIMTHLETLWPHGDLLPYGESFDPVTALVSVSINLVVTSKRFGPLFVIAPSLCTESRHGAPHGTFDDTACDIERNRCAKQYALRSANASCE